ncbi:MAG: serine hydrolase domain-containing protein [Bacteriovorax sp.]
MKKTKAYLYFILVFFNISNALANTTRWPIPDWEVADNASLMEQKTCKDFQDFSTRSSDFLTDDLLVIKDGQIVFEYYDSQYNANKPHALWSVSKTITGALLGTAVRDGRIGLNQSLHNFYPQENADENYRKIMIQNLLYLDTGYIWDESKLDILENPVLGMLFGKGHMDMARYAVTKKIIKEGPSYKWNYSTGTPTITMGVLKKIYGSEYDDFPWRNLFNPLGMKNVAFERDGSGTFIGGASAFTTPRDLAKIGYLYLNNGIWNGEVLLPMEWIKLMLTPSPGYVSPGTVITNITEDGVYGGSIWLNREVKKGLGKPYPHSPEDMYLAIGFMGQYLIMLPSQKMIIVRMGHDRSANSKLDAFVSKAIACFYDPNYKVGEKLPKNPVQIKIGNIIKNIKNAVQANALQASIAKTICSCHLISDIDINTCLDRYNFSLSSLLTKIAVKKDAEPDGLISVQVRLSRFAHLFKHHNTDSAKAYFDPVHAEYGCTLK